MSLLYVSAVLRGLSAYLLLKLGKREAEPTAVDIQRVLSAVDIEIPDEEAEYVVEKLSHMPIEELVALGSQKLCAVRSFLLRFA
jgi:large subunit ribosomal protein LP2